MPSTLTLQRLPAVLAARGVGRSQHYLDVSRGLWTKPLSLGLKVAAWPAHETDALIAARIAGAEDPKIRDLVAQLHERRQTLLAEVQSRYLNPDAAGRPSA